MPQDTLGSFAAFEYRGHDQIRAAHHIAAGKNFGVGGLESGLRRAGNTHPAVAVQIDFMRFKPVGGTRQKSRKQ